MDSSTSLTSEPIDFNKLSDADKRELQQFIVNETAVAKQREGRLSPYPSAYHPNTTFMSLS